MFITECTRRPVFAAASRISAASSCLAIVCISIASNPASRPTAKRSAYGSSLGSIEISTAFLIVFVVVIGGVLVHRAAPPPPRLRASARAPASGQARTVPAPDGRILKAGLIGCGGRGRGAAVNFLDSGPNLQVTALADLFPDRVAKARETLKDQRGQQIPESRCFTGFDG